jgi:hypothetical protein
MGYYLYISEVHAAILIAYGGELSFINFSKLLHGFLQLMLKVDIASPNCDVGPTSVPVCASAIAKIHV